jgi:glycosyltransferase involved in cell wall biosynthesis/2-polyprenyl-3-methyl-5-hydroxy-6-metoxy-1,4-benzoquinol methylase
MSSTPSHIKNYPLLQTANESDLEENHSLTKQLHLVGSNKRVVDFGCATGYFAQFLKQRGCYVVGVELNPEAAGAAEQYCDQVLVADLDYASIPDLLPDQKFDVAVFGDVLEHLRNPWQVLEEVRQILQPDGYVVASIPNIAHGAVRLALLQGRFEYADLGLLDNTHLRFFTRKTVQDLFERTGYEVSEMNRTVVPVFSDSSSVPKVERRLLSDEVIRQVEQAEDADTLQFIVRAFPLTIEGKYAALNLKYSRAVEQNVQLQTGLLSLQGELEQLKDQNQQTQGQLQQAQGQFQQIQGQLQQTQQMLEQTTAMVQWMQTSKFWKLRLAWLQFRQWLLGSPHHDPFQIKHVPQLLHNTQETAYDRWQKLHSPQPEDLQNLAKTINLLPHKPLISVIMPVFNPPEPFLRAAIESVVNQIYPYWELCLADDASTVPHVRQLLEYYQATDSRIKVTFRTTNGHISHCSNSALELATGEFVVLLDHDDSLTPDALGEVALLLNRQPDADMIYSDEDKLDEQEKLRDPYFKPDWCPDSFLARMYTCHLGAYRRSLVEAIGGFRPGYEGSQDYDLVLRLTEQTDKIFHIPKILYHWRIHPGSVASNTSVTDVKPYASLAAKRALTEALSRRGTPGKILDYHGCTGKYTVRYQIKTYKLVSIIIPTKDLGRTLDQCLKSIFSQTTYPNYEVIVIDNGSIEKETADIIQYWLKQKPKQFKCAPLDIPFNYSKINNYAVSQASGEFLLFLNNDTEVITPDWVDAMVEQAQRTSIGAVGVQLLYPDNTVQHAGVVAGLGGVAGHSHKHFFSNESGYFYQIQTINNYSAVTGACLMCRRDAFLEVGGFEEQLAIAFNDVDLCFKFLEKGYRNIYLPHVKLYHYESKSRGYEDTPEKQARFKTEIDYIRLKWHSLINHDPCYSPHLTRDREDYSLNI